MNSSQNQSRREERRVVVAERAQGLLEKPWFLALAAVGILAAGAILAVLPAWSFALSLYRRIVESVVEVNLLTAFLAALFTLIAGVYLLAQGWKFLRAARDPVAREELLGEMRPRSKELRYSLHLLRKSLLAMVGLGIIVGYVTIALLGPYISPFPYTVSIPEKHVPPGAQAALLQTLPAERLLVPSGSGWVNASDMLRSDDARAQSNTTDDSLLLYHFNFSVPFNFVGASQVDVGVEAYSPEDHAASVAVSWDNGTSWTPDQTVPFKTTDDDALWYMSFGSLRSWSLHDVNISNFMVRLTHVQDSGPAIGTLFVDYVVARVVVVGPVHPWGTTDLGQDVLTGILLGTAADLRIGIIVVAASVAIGVVLGVFSGYLGGRVDELLMRITDMFLAIPGLILAIAFAAALGRSLENVLIALVLVSWPSYTRLVRGQALSVREASYVEAARAVGANTRRVVTRHVLPNTLSPVIVAATLDLGTIVLSTAGLSFIGIGSQPTEAEWGIMISRGYQFMVSGFWWEFLTPGIAIFLFVLAFNLFGDGLRDILDPRLRR